jgi:hypothetical protein
MTLTGKTYDILKFIAMVGLPALATLYLGFGQLWEWPETEKVVSSIVLINTFLGALLQLNSRSYNRNDANFDGYLGSKGVDPDTGIPNLQMTVTTPPEDMLAGESVRLKVGSPPPA